MHRFPLPVVLLLLAYPLPTAVSHHSARGQEPAVRESTATNEVPAVKDEADSEAGGPARKSVRPGINDRFKDPELNPEEWIARFEVESREVFRARDEILDRLSLKPGSRVADIGAGTGFFSLLMSKAVGESGWVYAVDISPKLVEHMVRLFDRRNVDNITTVLCDDDSVCLPPKSVELAYICDVYHHFEYPRETLRSIHAALADGGRLVVVDFERIPGVSREWTLSHVRAGKATFREEIEAAGFELIAERSIPGFKENYYLEFRKR